MSSRQDFSPTVDSLRAIAVAAVVIFHSAPAWAPGEFVGVDIFFVISGYLILNQIVASWRRGTFSFSEFWARRALRILPPYITVVVTTLIAAAFILLTKEEFKEVYKEAFASASMTANILFSRHKGYFDPRAEELPLLHLWTLSVEEQFYVLAPLIIAAAYGWKLSKQQRPPSLIVLGTLLFVISLIACLVMSHTDESSSAFYFTPLRAWEFIAGGAIASLVPILRFRSHYMAEALVLFGLSSICASIFLFSSTMAYPSWAGIVPVTGACLVIIGGEAYRGGLAQRVLFTPPVLGLGLISYSVYLWHWPLLCLARIANFGEMPLWLGVASVTASVVLAILTYFFIERPIRLWRQGRRANLGWWPVNFGIAACSMLAMLAIGYGWWFSRFSPVALSKPVIDWSDECDLTAPDAADTCLASSAGYPLGIIMGDSHAGAAFRVLSRIAESQGKRLGVLAFPGCSPFLNAVRANDKRPSECKGFRMMAESSLKKVSVDFAILDAQWKFDERELVPDEDSAGLKSQREVFLDAVRYDLRMLRAAGAHRIVIVGPIPITKLDVPKCIIRADHFKIAREKCAVARQDYEDSIDEIVNRLKQVSDEFADVRLIDPVSVFCDENWCRPYDGNTLLYLDHDHLSPAGVTKLYEQRQKAFDWAMGIKQSVIGSSSPSTKL